MDTKNTEIIKNNLKHFIFTHTATGLSPQTSISSSTRRAIAPPSPNLPRILPRVPPPPLCSRFWSPPRTCASREECFELRESHPDQRCRHVTNLMLMTRVNTETLNRSYPLRIFDACRLSGDTTRSRPCLL